MLTEEVIRTCTEVAEVAQGFHTNVLIKYISSDEIIKYEEINDRLNNLKLSWELRKSIQFFLCIAER